MLKVFECHRAMCFICILDNQSGLNVSKIDRD